MNFWEKITKPKAGPVGLAEAGVHHYLFENGEERSRLHLRLDQDGHGTLIVNASRILHLNPTAARMAFLSLEQTPTDQAIQNIKKQFRVSSDQARQDYRSIQSQLDELVRPDGACPIHEMDLDTLAPFSARPSAPYRMDLAITYRCNNDCSHCYNQEHPGTTNSSAHHQELGTQAWKQVLNRLWDLGIPHIIFTGGEPTLRNDLPELIAHAESNGQITGLNTNARRLADPEYVSSLVQAGLDHVQITLESSNASIHDQMVHSKGAFAQTVKGIQNVLSTRLYVMTNTTMLQDNIHTISSILDFLSDLGVPTVGLNALIYSGRGESVGSGLPETQLTPLLEIASRKTQEHGQRLIWYTPTQYCHFDPTQLDLGVKGCTAALYNMCIEPDGSILPCQSYYKPLGNILKDPWDSIWNHPLAIRLRERQGLPEKCTGCGLLSECGGGCPLQMDLAEAVSITMGSSTQPHLP
jgi:radical SAM protein with 4Fe4S-binding SPASM domain